MITVQLCGEFDFSHKDLSIRNYEKSITTDCWMKFHINEDLFFDDWICPLEMYYQYLDWKKNYDNGLVQSFEYTSDDNGENPILSFRQINNMWIAYSVLTKRNSDFITLHDVLNFFELFSSQLMQHQND